MRGMPLAIVFVAYLMNVLYIRREYVVERLGNGERTVRKFVIGFERTKANGASYAMKQRAQEMRDHPAFACSKRFLFKENMKRSDSSLPI